MIHVNTFFICAAVVVIFGIAGIFCFLNSRHIGILTQKKKGLERDISGLQARLEAATAAEAKARGEKANIDSEIAMRQGELGCVKKAIEDARKDPDLIAYNAKKDEIKERIGRLAKDYWDKSAELQQKNKEIADADQALGAKKQDLEATVKILNEITKEAQKLDAQIKGMHAEKTKLEQELKDKANKLNETKNDINDLEREKKELEKRNQEKTAELEQKNKELEKLDARYQEGTQRLRDMNVEVNALEGRKSAAEAFLREAPPPGEHVWDELKNRVREQFPDGNADGETDESTWLSTFNENLKTAGYKFDERRIKAFHTSLKCSGISPLTVLSGISGTGKSLLPQLYARAAGMHFTILPVQPRWDNPSDIFGFYNYLDRHFKATELSRIFYEMEERKKNGECENDFPMHIVLLDEMNLARVEYYFSDFLSKLETRRTDCDKARITLECAGAGKNAAPITIYPWENVLFVGTMNEDETTQTLSDKVLDRANVLRFGAPKNFQELVCADSATDFVKNYGTIRARKWKEWKTWRKKSAELKNREELRKKLEKINEAIQQMDRAFAHRVVQAVESYVANYPGVNGIDFNDDSCRNAVSDAIEMKVFPKLNGLDKTDSAFKDVRRIISVQIGNLDDSLKEAFERVGNENASSPFFKWTGTQR